MLGALSILIFVPIIEQLCEVIMTALEYVKGLISKSVLKINKELLDLQAEQEPISTQCIGFQYNGDEEEFDDDFEDKIKLGFHA